MRSSRRARRLKTSEVMVGLDSPETPIARRRRFVVRASCPPRPHGEMMDLGAACSKPPMGVRPSIKNINLDQFIASLYWRGKSLSNRTDSSRQCALAREGEVKTSTTIALALGIFLAGPVAAQTQTPEPTPQQHYQVHHHQGPHHTVHHHVAAPNPAPAPVVVAPAPATQAAPFGLSWPRIAPYPDGKGDEDGLSEDPNDCNKGCIDGNTPD